MKKLYRKSQLGFALMWIGIYCVLQSVAYPLNEAIGTAYSASAILCAVQALVLYAFIRRNNLETRYGLFLSPIPASRFLFYVPLIVLISYNLWFGVGMNMDAAATACYLIAMLFVGFVEEVIFRGLLFVALAKDSVRTAIVISSVTFGIGHMINLVNGSGAELTENIFQVTGAICIGFLFVVLFYRGESLLPCILAHSAINMTSAFSKGGEAPLQARLVAHGALIAITLGYALILTKTLPKRTEFPAAAPKVAASRR